MNRTGITYDGAIGLAEKIAGLHGGRFIGFHCYDGDRHEKEYSRREEKVIETIDDINRLKEKVSVFCDRPVIIAGGSPSFPCYANNMPGGYYSPGTVFIYDAGYLEQFPDLPFTPAAAVLSRVVSHPGKGIFTLDTGYKAISAEQSRPGILLDVPGSEPMFQSEEHWTYRMTEGHEGECPEIGKLVYIIPWHVCPTTALYSKVHVVEKGKVVGTWNITARDRMI
jgi:D-serine deaminase-like pyridoxal phosphate-dependent protein